MDAKVAKFSPRLPWRDLRVLGVLRVFFLPGQAIVLARINCGKVY